MTTVPMPTQTDVKRGDLKPDLIYYAYDAARNVADRADLTDVVSWRLIAVRGSTVVFTDTAPDVSVPDPAEPWRVALTHLWAPAETATVGRLEIEAEAMWPGGKPQTFPKVTVDVKADLG